MEQEETITAAEKLLIGAQLISENFETVVNSDLVSALNRQKLTNLGNRSCKFVDLFWKQLDNEEVEKEFQGKVRSVEEVFEKIYGGKN